MKQVRIFLMAIQFVFFVAINSFSQPPSSANSKEVFFAGSTACDNYIRSQLKIPTGTKCDFIKWELHVTKKTNNAGIFTVSISYGEAKQNTNGFMETKKIDASGNFDIREAINKNLGVRLFYLQASNFQSPLILAEMDSNVFHFTDNNKKLLVGNGGWSYSLYKMEE
jgi:hypothetical protein